MKRLFGILLVILMGLVSMALGVHAAGQEVRLEHWEVVAGEPVVESVAGVSAVKLNPPSLDVQWDVGDYVLFPLPKVVDSGILTFRYRMWLGGTARGLVVSVMEAPEDDAWLTNYADATVYPACDGGQLKFYKDTWRFISAVPIGEWIDVQVDADFDRREFTVYLNGQFAGMGLFRHDDVTTAAGIGFMLYQGNLPAQPAYFTDVSVVLP